MLSNRSMPRCTVIPELAYSEVGEASDWLCDVFGFTVRLRIASHRVLLNVGAGAVVLTEMAADQQTAHSAHSVMVRVDDVDRHHGRAKLRGVRILRPPYYREDIGDRWSEEDSDRLHSWGYLREG